MNSIDKKKSISQKSCSQKIGMAMAKQQHHYMDESSDSVYRTLFNANAATFSSASQPRRHKHLVEEAL